MGKSKSAAQGAQPSEEPHRSLRLVYLKDVSFESPNAPDTFKLPSRGIISPVMRSNLTVSHIEMGNDEYEVAVRLTVQATAEDDKTYFLLEVEQAGIFKIMGVSGEELKRLLKVDCPRTVYPFAREMVWSIVSRGGFPNLLLQDIDFESLSQLG